MLLRNFAFFILEAGRGLFKNGWMSLASIGVVSIALFIFGVFVLLSMNLDRWSEELLEQIEIVVFIEDEATVQEKRDLLSLIENHEHVREVEFVSKEEAFQELEDILGPEALEGYEPDSFQDMEDNGGGEVAGGYDPEFNPLRDSYIIRAWEPEQVFVLIDELEKFPAVGEVVCHKEVVEKLTSFTWALQFAALILIILLAVAATFFISHTIRLTVMLRSKEIMIMKYVGATDSFIRLPFLFEGLFLGVLGSLIPMILLYYGYSSLLGVVEVELAFLPMVPFEEAMEGVARLLLPLGVGLGVVGSIFSISRYLKV